MSIQPKFFIAVLLLAACTLKGWAQTDNTKSADDLMSMLDKEESGKKHKEYIAATFKATRIINGHSIMNQGKGILDFRIMHRFGPVNGGATEFWGLDGANTKLALDYGVTDWLMVGVSRSVLRKEYDGFAKVKLLRQMKSGMPVSVSYVGGACLPSIAAVAPDGSNYSAMDKMCYFNQILIARKFNDWVAVQIMPTHLHYNIVPTSSDKNDIMALGIGGRLKVSNRIALTAEYYYVPTPLKGSIFSTGAQTYHNSLSVGVDIETGGHVFQLFFSNSQSIAENDFIGQTTGQWSDGGVHFGFNISRVFTIIQPSEFKNSRNKIW
jgi:hypothetical protein